MNKIDRLKAKFLLWYYTFPNRQMIQALVMWIFVILGIVILWLIIKQKP